MFITLAFLASLALAEETVYATLYNRMKEKLVELGKDEDDIAAFMEVFENELGDRNLGEEEIEEFNTYLDEMKDEDYNVAINSYTNERKLDEISNTIADFFAQAFPKLGF